jgi:Ser/Thr protein kinase RdoA (MazF antagonist)
LRRLALRALEAYDLAEPRLKAIIHETNTTFRVDAADGSLYVLRIHAPLARTAAAVQSELLWLAAIRRDTDLTVPEPIPTRSGELLTIADAEGVPEPRVCVLLLDRRALLR